MIMLEGETYIFLLIAGILLFIGFIFLRQELRDRKLLLTVTKTNRGTRTERALVLKLLKYGIPADTIFHDLYLQKSNGRYCQIDVAVVTEAGVIVFEVKEYSGWLFGKGYDSQWTQVLAYGKVKHRFYNPVIQNTRHVQELKKIISPENIPVFSVVIFYGDCVFKDISFIPEGTYLAKSEKIVPIIKRIMTNDQPVNYQNKTTLFNVLNNGVRNGENYQIRDNHARNIVDMLGKNSVFD